MSGIDGAVDAYVWTSSIGYLLEFIEIFCNVNQFEYISLGIDFRVGD